jgi:hypothetical protein
MVFTDQQALRDPVSICFELHGISFRLNIAKRELRERALEVLNLHGFQAGPSEGTPAGGSILIETDEQLPTLPSGLREVGVDDNDIVLYEGGERFYLRAPGASFAVDLNLRQVWGVVLTSYQERVGLLVMQLTMWSLILLLRQHHFFSLHAAALTGEDGRGIIATGPSGSGKSTLACNLLRSGWHFLSDDTVLLHPGADDVEVYSFRTNFSLREDSRVLFPEFVSHWKERPTGERKQWVPMRELFPEQARERGTPRALVFPQIMDQPRSRLVEIPPADALHILVGQSALVRFRRDWAKEHLALLVRLTRQAPSYRLEAGRDLVEDPERSHQLLSPLLTSEPLRNAVSVPAQ